METERHLPSVEPRIRTATKFIVRTPSNVLETNFTSGYLYIFPPLEEHFRHYSLTVHGGLGVSQMKEKIIIMEKPVIASNINIYFACRYK